MHIYISQRALEEGMDAIVEEMVPFSYMMLREGYDAESIIQFLENAEDEDFDYIYEQADSEMLSESVVDEMSDEEVLLYEEQIGFIVENVILRNLLRRMSPAALQKFVKNNAAARRLAERLGLLKKGPIPKTGTPKPTTTPKSTTPKPTSSRTSQQQAQTRSQPPKPTKTPPKTKPGGGILKSPAARTTATVLGGAAIGLGLNQAGLFPGANDPNIGNDGPGQSDSPTETKPAETKPAETKPAETKPPKEETKPSSKGTGRPWWVALDKKLLSKPSTFRSDVALNRFRNPSGAMMTRINSHYEYLVDYLIAEGHADTVEEATYVMEQMGEEAAVEILNEVI